MAEILHPRPSPLAAAMYTMRDLDAEVIILHGPSGCSFKPARLLEKDGVRVVTTALSDQDFVFGGETKLVNALKRVDELFHPNLIGVVGTCASMIIGEDLRKAARNAGLEGKTICCDVHSGSGDNTVGAVMVLKEACQKGLISSDEFERQRVMLEMATEVEKARGTARDEYLDTALGDSPASVAKAIIETMKGGGRVTCVLNAKKETVFLYADLILAMAVVSRKLGAPFETFANLNPKVGLPRIRGYAVEVLDEIQKAGCVVDVITGGLDEYPLAGRRARDHLLANPPDLAVVSGIPHAVAVEGRMKAAAVTVGTRAAFNLKSLGYDMVVAERDAHAVSLGIGKKVRRSFLGAALRREAHLQ